MCIDATVQRSAHRSRLHLPYPPLRKIIDIIQYIEIFGCEVVVFVVDMFVCICCGCRCFFGCIDSSVPGVLMTGRLVFLLKKNKVSGFPTILLLDESGNKLKEYNGDRTAKSLEEFLN